MNCPPRWLIPILTSAVLLAGCDSGEPEKHAVSGVVTWNDHPLSDGDIIFTPVDGGVPVAAKIVDGKFDLQATAGRHRVAVLATREVGEVDPLMGARGREMYIPVRYNQQSSLSAEIMPGKPNHFEFPLSADE